MGQAGQLTTEGRENGNAMRLNRKVTFVPCTVGKACTYPTGSIPGKIYMVRVYIYIYVYDEHTDRDNSNERNMSKRWFFLRIDT